MTEDFEAWQPPQLMTAAELATLFRVHQKTVYAWIKAGKLKAERTPLGGIRINASEVSRLLNAGSDKIPELP